MDMFLSSLFVSSTHLVLYLRKGTPLDLVATTNSGLILRQRQYTRLQGGSRIILQQAACNHTHSAILTRVEQPGCNQTVSNELALCVSSDGASFQACRLVSVQPAFQPVPPILEDGQTGSRRMQPCLLHPFTAQSSEIRNLPYF